MKKMFCVLTLYLVISVSMLAQSNGPLYGKYNETSGQIWVDSEFGLGYETGQSTCWLYKLPLSMIFDDLVVEFCEYLENELPLGTDRGWPIYWDNGLEEISLETDLANTIRAMMNRLKRNVSMFLTRYVNSSAAAPPVAAYISYYDSSKGTFTTLRVSFWN
jgi:hypothetical protein